MGLDDAIEICFDVMEAITPYQHWVLSTALKFPSMGGPILTFAGLRKIDLQKKPRTIEAIAGVLVIALMYWLVWWVVEYFWSWWRYIPFVQAMSTFIAQRTWLRYLWFSYKARYMFPSTWAFFIETARAAYLRSYPGLLLVTALARLAVDSCTKSIVSRFRTLFEKVGIGKDTEFLNSGSELDSYVYSPLTGPRDIRLLQWPLRTISGRDVDPKLVHCAIGKNNYDCVSYVWGTEAKANTVIVESWRLEVTISVVDILSGLRPLLRGINLWIDAVCIDQSCDQEKTQQVRMMAEIYRNARKVIVWLGEDKLMHSVEASILLKELRWIAKNYHRRPYYASTDRLGGRYYHRRWQALGALLRKPWFERVWTIQEAVMASKIEVFYSGITIPWQALVDVGDFMTKTEAGRYLNSFLLVSEEGKDWYDTRLWPSLRPRPECFHRVPLITVLRERQRDGNDLSTFRDILRLMFNAKATQARDVLYGVQGLLADQKSDILLPDYNATENEVFIRAARSLLSLDHPLDMLAYAGITKSRSLDLPSWVPDLGHLPKSPILTLPFDESMRYCASGDSACKTHVSSDYRIVTVNGSIIDKISLLGSEINLLQCEEGTDIAEYSLQFADKFLEARNLYSPPMDCPDPTLWQNLANQDIWRTMAGDRDLANDLQPLSKEYAEEGLAWEMHWKKMRAFLHNHPEIHRDKAALKQQLMTSQTVPQCLEDYRALMNDHQLKIRSVTAVANVAHGRRFCVTAKGRAGLVPDATQVGDSIAVIMGAQTPFVLRKAKQLPASRTEDTNLYNLVGECYVHGAMNGVMLRCGFPVTDVRLV